MYDYPRNKLNTYIPVLVRDNMLRYYKLIISTYGLLLTWQKLKN